jgi:leader peptidase (prepilin peptidase)/N-methyltransferase
MLTGLLTGVVGALVGTFLLRMVGFLFSAGLGKDALGMGDADLMMMAGSFVGWQIVVVAFFLSAIPALFFGILQLIVNKDNSMPFGPSLSFSVMATMLAWQPLGEVTRTFLFNDVLLIIAVVLCASMLFGSAFLIRAVRGKEEPT